MTKRDPVTKAHVVSHGFHARKDNCFAECAVFYGWALLLHYYYFFLQITFLPAQIFPVPFSTLIGYSKKITTAKSYSNWSSHSDTSRYVMTNLLQSFMDT